MKLLKTTLASIISILCLSNISVYAETTTNKTSTHSTGTTKTTIVKSNKSIDLLTDSKIESILDDSLTKITNTFINIGNKVLDEATKPKPINVINAEISAPSVSSLKITWDAEENREYEVSYHTFAEYPENITFVYPNAGLCYLTGLRINSEYDITITPVIKEDENFYAEPITLKGITPNVDVIQEFEYEDGWTGCFAGERASGLRAMPSSGAIYGSFCDTITGTGIRRHENGDYACAMGTHYGYCNDRFLIELENGIQFTVRICDSKGAASVQDEYGLGKYHWFGSSGKCIIEFIYDDGHLPGSVAFTGSWGGYNWNGLNLNANIRSIKKLAYY